MRSNASRVLGDRVVHDTVGPLSYTYVRLRLGQADAYHGLTRSDPHAIYYSFAENPDAFLMRDNGRTERIDVAANTSGGTGSEPLRWVGAPAVLEFVEFGAPGHARLTVAEDAGRPDLADLATLSGLRDPAAEVAGRRLRAAALGGEPLNELEAETIMLAVLRQRITFLGGKVRRRTDHGLDARRLKRIVDYIDAHLTDDLRTETLADVAAVSRFHFARMFEKSTGLSPHRFLTARRMDLAMQLLLSGRSITSAAKSTGYVSGHQFRTSFRAAFGRTPRSVKDAVRSK